MSDTWYVTVSVVGTDEQGRTLVLCPFCHERAHIDPDDGRIACPTGDSLQTFLDDALKWLVTVEEPIPGGAP